MFDEELICESCDREFSIHYYSEIATVNFCPFCGNKLDDFNVEEEYDRLEFTDDDDN